MIEDYVVYKSNVVLENQKELIEDLEVCMNTILFGFKVKILYLS